MTHMTIGAMPIADLIMGWENKWAWLYDPARKAARPAPMAACCAGPRPCR